MIQRRAIITGLLSLMASPAIVRADGLMKVTGERYFFWKKSLPLLPDISRGYPSQEACNSAFKEMLGPNGHLYEGTWTFFGKTGNAYTDEIIAFSKREYAPATEVSDDR